MTSPFAQFDSLRSLFAAREPGDHGIRPGFVLWLTLLFSFLLGPAIVERMRWSRVSEGLLVRDVTVAETADDKRQCRSDGCSFEAFAPAPAAPAAVQVRLEPDPVKRYPVPARFVFRNSMPAWSASEWVAVDQAQEHLPAQWVVRFGSNDRTGSRWALAPVDGPGLVTRMFSSDPDEAPIQIADVMRRTRLREEQALTSKNQDGASEDGPAPRMLTFEFQPIGERLSLLLEGPNDEAVGTGDRVALRLGRRSDDHEHSPSGIVERVDADRSGGTRLTVRMTEEGRHWIRGWLDIATRTGAPPLPDRMSVSVTRRLGHSTGLAVRVPATALVAADTSGGPMRAAAASPAAARDRAIVWTVVENFAVPVPVRVGPVSDGWALVGEIEHPGSGGLRRDDWVTLSPWQRKRLLELRPLGGGNTLLGERARVIAQPAASLRPGLPVRAL